MNTLLLAVKRFLRDEDGGNAIEYALIASLVGVAIVAGLGLLGDNLNTMFNNLAGCFTTTPGGLCAPAAAPGN